MGRKKRKYEMTPDEITDELGAPSLTNEEFTCLQCSALAELRALEGDSTEEALAKRKGLRDILNAPHACTVYTQSIDV